MEKSKKGVIIARLLLLLCLALFIDVSTAAKTSKQFAMQCQTEACREARNEILSMIDLKADPCENPHQFFCGNWLKKFKLPGGTNNWKYSWSTVSERAEKVVKNVIEQSTCPAVAAGSGRTSRKDSYEEMLGCYYQACLDTKKIEDAKAEPLIRQLKSAAPSLYQRASQPDLIDREGATLSVEQKATKLGKLVANLWVTFDVTTWFYFMVENSIFNDSGSKVLFMYEDGVGLDYQEYEDDDAVAGYLESINRLLTEITADSQTGSVADLSLMKQQIEERASAVLQMERDILKLHFTPEERIDPQKTEHHLKSKKEIQSLIGSSFDLDSFFAPLMKLATNASETDKENFIVNHVSFFSGLGSLIKTKWTWGAIHDYLLFKTISRHNDGLPEKYQSSVGNRSAMCHEIVKWDLGLVLSLEYIKTVKSAARRIEIAQTIFSEVKFEMAEVIKKAEWMDADSKRAAQKKLNATQGRFGYPSWMVNNPTSHIKQAYGDANIEAVRDFIGAKLHFINLQKRKYLSKISQLQDEEESIFDPYDADGVYAAASNSVQIPLAVLQEPFLRLWTEDSAAEEKVFMKTVTYGGLGIVIGHEITHGFDRYGSGFGPTGKQEQWMSEKSLKAFEGLEKCMSRQYSQYKVEVHRPSSEADTKTYAIKEVDVPGQQMLRESIADNGGVKLAYNALQRQFPNIFTSEPDDDKLSDKESNAVKLFSAALGQYWCLAITDKEMQRRVTNGAHPRGAYAILGVLNNFDAFARAFHCKDKEESEAAADKAADSYLPENVKFFRSLVLNENGMSTKNPLFDRVMFDQHHQFEGQRRKTKCSAW